MFQIATSERKLRPITEDAQGGLDWAWASPERPRGGPVGGPDSGGGGGARSTSTEAVDAAITGRRRRYGSAERGGDGDGGASDYSAGGTPQRP